MLISCNGNTVTWHQSTTAINYANQESLRLNNFFKCVSISCYAFPMSCIVNLCEVDLQLQSNLSNMVLEWLCYIINTVRLKSKQQLLFYDYFQTACLQYLTVFIKRLFHNTFINAKNVSIIIVTF